MLFENVLPNLPSSPLGTTFIVLAVLGGILLVYAVFVERELQHDLLRAIGAFTIIPHTLYTGNTLLSVIFAAVSAASLLEFFEIFVGFHRHTKQDIRAYRHDGED